ncbi:DNA polymerase I [Candidatus Omnitrophota bacterium]
MKKKVFLIDGNSFCYRAFYAIKGLATSKGMPTNAVYGFITMLNKLIAEHRPEYLGVAFDLKGPTFRHQRYADYKIHRKPMPDDLSIQLPVVKKVLGAYHISVFEQQGYEADDVIATLAKMLCGPKQDVFIVTGDKDILQIVGDSIKIINPHKDNTILGPEWVKQKYGVAPEQVVDIMALAGDQTDHIPGVPGIGEATAVELIRQFGSLDQVLAKVDEIKNKSRSAKIKQFSQQAQMSKELAQLELRVPDLIQRPPQALLKQLELVEADQRRLFSIFKELEFKGLMQNVAQDFEEKIDYKIVSDEKEVDENLAKIARCDCLGLYLGTDQANPMLAKITGIAFAFGKNEIVGFTPQKSFFTKVKPILESAAVQKIGHNLKYAKVILSNYGITLGGIDFDTMLAAYLLNPAKLTYSLGELALEYLNRRLEQSSDGFNPQLAAIILKLSKILKQQLKQNNLLALFKDTEVPLVAVLAEMEQQGVCLDKQLLLQTAQKFDQKIKKLTKEIYALAETEFNINSPKQLSVVLFEKLQLPKIKRTKTGASTDTEVLKKLSAMHPIADQLLEFREISKLKSTYLDGMLKLLHPRTGRIHTSFNQTGTATGRLSSRGPNLQNIPIKTALGASIRQIFIPGQKGDLLLSADYSQIELRILAHLSGDKNLISAFNQDRDIHAFTASLIFGQAQEEISRKMRDTAKTVNFGIIYGISAFGLARDLKINQAQAQEFIESYFNRYPGVKSFIQRQIEKAQRNGFVTTLLNRRRYIPEIKSRQENVRQFAQRVAINAPVQGSASDLIKAAMIEIYRSLKEQCPGTKMIIQVHDELVFSLPPEERDLAKELIASKMENVIKLKVPVKVAIKTGPDWLNME